MVCGCRSVAQSCWTLCNPTDCVCTPGFRVLRYLLESAQILVHWVGDATWPSHPLSPSSSAFNLSQHQGLFQWVSSLHQVTKVVELQLQHQSFQPWMFRVDFLYDWLVWSPCSSRDSEESSLVQKHQFFSTQPSLLSSSHIHMWLLEKPSLWLDRPLSAKWRVCLLTPCLRLFIAFLPKEQSSSHFMAAVTVCGEGELHFLPLAMIRRYEEL